ncbi:MAG: ImmA/IrrE family metallo-endopeptidase [Desulfobacula sp.]|jgi:Zn-dependent peptidase ImmA (M78 family)|nr:ImmA/IrrE family metallo-endopeptidase [Desulfobacula sp.]MBT6615390.1 ImmA/IrrE family metallo-endopeptidase [Deltaproteobacteria bacterium]
MAGRVENINNDILRQCREQIGLSLPVVAKKVAKIAAIEQGDQKPTFKQIDTLADLYKVPRWVFISDHLPEKYQFDKAIPAFRQLADSNADVFSEHKVRSLTARVSRFRELILELREDMGEPVTAFHPPDLKRNATPDFVAQQVRDWLDLTEESFEFSKWKEMLEEKNIFIFMTSKYMGWSHVDRALFRGLAIYHQKLPIIIINDSDAKKAQSFTLFHELGHLLRKESAIDDWSAYHQRVEKWCDELSGNVLMPAEQILSAVDNIDGLDAVKDIAKCFKVSPYACLVRLRQMMIIDQGAYLGFEAQLKAEYRKLQKKLKESDGGPARNRPQEVLKQYGHIYANALFQAYHNKEIGLHKLCQAFDLKRASYALEMDRQL